MFILDMQILPGQSGQLPKKPTTSPEVLNLRERLRSEEPQKTYRTGDTDVIASVIKSVGRLFKGLFD